MNRRGVSRKSLNDDELKKAIDGCDSEQIHIPGSIQPHGYMLVLSQEFEIVKVSRNFCSLIDQPLQAIIGQDLKVYFGEDIIKALKDMLSVGALCHTRYTTLSFIEKEDLPQFDAVLHQSKDYLILELEIHKSGKIEFQEHDFYQKVMQFSIQLQQVPTQTALYDYVVYEMRQLTGFGRVKLYRFDQNWNGEVVAESRDMQIPMPSYLGLHFPASDIPKQARKLYSQNFIRLIADTSYESVQIVPDDLCEKGLPIDLSYACLRSVSPVHMEYLNNMGVGASMSISVMQNERLWGLIACHHNSPLHPPISVRMAAELMTHTFSAFLSNFMQADQESEIQKKQSYIRELNISLRPDKSMLETLKRKHALLLQAVDADGVIVHVNDKNFAFGLIPEMSFANDLIDWLEMNGDGKVFASNSIARDTNLLVRGQSMASGVLAIPVSSSMTDYVMWFRQELVEEIDWAGRPEKRVTKDKVGYHLTPRASFARWKEGLRGYAKAWEADNIEAAEHITKLLLNKKYEDKLRQANYDLQSILDNSSAFIYITDTSGNIIRINESAIEAFGLNSENIVGYHYREVFSGEFVELEDKQQETLISSQKSATFNADFFLNEKEFHLITVKFPLYDTNDDIYALCSISTDVSMLHNTQEELRRSNKELERLAFIASHDLQEPIRIISNFTGLLGQEYKDILDDNAKVYIDFTLNAAERMRFLINDLLEFSRMGHEEYEPEIIDARGEIVRLIEQFKILDTNQDASITIEGNIPDIYMKLEHFSCVMQNLISNALKFKDKQNRPVINISCQESKTDWLFAVSDNGIGIEKEYFDKIFLLFQRLYNKSEYDGTGIGLALVSRILERYNGKIWVESEYGKGSCFYFTIPKKEM
ncbi:ATP-binding protein [Spartinivicinus poritis]|uniref:histidine kinase n=1 Tax=Spartinivicinus poritis TaxID=2994640 RepID=A0ABT5U364_9GAMM|nr:ATP-binding protein [Spartinivicinus sp. A2-2]MDE1460810.1 ATP-binding protein [Spartinivicinus sp. A2-2]